MCLFALASILLSSSGVSQASECHPIINEISSLRFTTSAATQYFELALNDACNSKSNVKLNEYGLLVLNTKSRRVKKPDHFNTITFVDFGNHKWPREDGELAKYFVIGSSAVETTSIDWNFYSAADKHAQCSRFVNWPQCLVRLIDPHQACKIDTFFTSLSTPQRNTEMPQTVFALVHLPNANDANLFKTYFSLLKTTDSRNVVYRRNHLDVSSDQQRWLSTRLKHIVALSPTSDHTKMLPMDRLIPIFGCPTTIVLHHLPPDAINDIISVSLCGCRWALTVRSPGSDNHCEGENFKRLPPKISLHSHISSTPCISDEGAQRLDTDEAESYPVDRSSSEEPPTSSQQQHVSQFSGHVDSVLNWMRIFDSKINDISECVQEISSGLRERNILYKEGLELGTEEKKKEFGLHRDDDERKLLMKGLSQLDIDGHKLSYKQKGLLMNMAWLSYYRDPSRQNADFIRCKLCNRDSLSSYNPDPDHGACEALDVEAVRRERKRKGPGRTTHWTDINLLGANQVLCLKQYRGQSTSRKATGITRLIERLQRHQKVSAEHQRNFDEFVIAVRSFDKSLSPEVMAATVTSTVTAYTIAKEGLPFAKQFPLTLMAMKCGAVSATAHYEATTAQRIVKQFAVHMKYDMLNYIISNDLPFSLLADGTSNDGVKWIVFLLRTVSPANRPITFHFSLVELESETADDIVKAFVGALKKYNSWAGPYGLWTEPYDFAMRKLVALSSDGASVMTGSLNGVHAQLKQLISISENSPRTDLLLSICSAHKLNLAVASLSGYGIKLAQAAIMEMHHLFGSNLRTKGRAFYNKAAYDMGFDTLHMDKLHKVRWSASLQNSLLKVLRMYPVLIEALNRMAADNSMAQNMRERAEIAEWVLKDGRTFIILHHVNAVLSHLTTLSKALQNEESLLVDHLTRWRHLNFLLENEQIKQNVHKSLVQERKLLEHDPRTGNFRNVEEDHLRRYCTYVTGSTDAESVAFLLAYNPVKFDDYKQKQVEKMETRTREATEGARSVKLFRSFDHRQRGAEPDLDIDLAYHMEDAPDFDVRQLASLTLGKLYANGMKAQTAEDHIDAFYDEVKNALNLYMTPGKRQSEPAADFSYALDRHIILDIIECQGDFNHFLTCMPKDTSPETRGYPAYVDKDNFVHLSDRKELILRSIKSIEKYCNLPSAEEDFLHFYDNVARNVERLSSWPIDLREDDNSLRIYQTLLNNAEELELRDSVVEAIKCLLVIPASNADPERSFSTANRLSRGERSNIGTETLDYLMTVERDGPSVLTVKPMKLARQWLHPRPILGLPKGKPSTFERDSSLMKQIKDSLAKGNSRALVELDIKEYMIVNCLNNREDSDEIRRSREDLEASKASIFSSGVLHVIEEDPTAHI